VAHHRDGAATEDGDGREPPVTLFSGPEYGSYVALMRELRLERKFEEGDYAAWAGSPAGPWTVLLTDGAAAHAGHRAMFGYGPGDQAWSVWLPRLDQLLAMLEDAGRPRIWFDPRPWPAGHALVTWETYITKPGQCWVAMSHEEASPESPTREEAAARLWIAITGRIAHA